MKQVCWVALVLLLAACGGGGSRVNLPEGDAVRGAALFVQSVNGAPACASCHALTSAALVGPGLAGVGAAAAARLPDVSAAEYLYASIVAPAQYIAPGFGNAMYLQYASKLTPQQIADLIAYMLTL